MYREAIGARTQRLLIGAAVVALSGPAAAEPVAGSRWGALPLANYDSNGGLGFGGMGTLSMHDPDVEPYRWALRLQVFFTTERIHAHELSWDVLRPADLRVRLSGRVGYYATIVRTFCGLGNAVTCDPAEAEASAAGLGLEPGSPGHDALVDGYYLRRFQNPWGLVQARVPGTRAGSAVSGFGGWRASYLVPGPVDGLAAHTLYGATYGARERGLVSLVQLGVMFDTRDDELVPGRGVWLEASARAAGAAIGSRWSFAGGNLTARGYTRLGPRLVLAGRAVADGIAGDPPVEELGYVGGSELYSAFGGQAFGRGVREHRYLGRIKVLAQGEARLAAHRRVTLVGFLDAGWIGLDWDDVGGDAGRVLTGFGFGLRGIWTRTFIVRADVGLSPQEAYSPQIYVYLGHLF